MQKATPTFPLFFFPLGRLAARRLYPVDDWLPPSRSSPGLSPPGRVSHAKLGGESAGLSLSLVWAVAATGDGAGGASRAQRQEEQSHCSGSRRHCRSLGSFGPALLSPPQPPQPPAALKRSVPWRQQLQHHLRSASHGRHGPVASGLLVLGQPAPASAPVQVPVREGA